MEPMLHLHQVAKRYGDTVAVEPTTLECPRGSTTVLIGPSGCGKSTLLKLTNGLVTPDSGEVHLDGVRLGAESVFLPALLRSRSARLRGLLWALHGNMTVPPLPRLGRRFTAPVAGFDPGLYQALGYRHMGGRTGPGGAQEVARGVVLRADTLERLAREAREARRLSAHSSFSMTPRIRDLAGGEAEAESVLTALGYRVRGMPDGTRTFAPARAANGKAGRRGRPSGGDDSPFAKLRELDRGT